MGVGISEVLMQESKNEQSARSVRRKTRSSTTLNRRYVKQPTKKTGNSVSVSVKSSAARVQSNTTRAPRKLKIIDPTVEIMEQKVMEAKELPKEEAVAPAEVHPIQNKVNSRMSERSNVAKAEPKVSAKELKDRAIQKALSSAAKMPEEEKKTKTRAKKDSNKLHFGFGRVVLALACATVTVFAIVYFVNLNAPDISLRVAAMQTGINASYPSYVPRDFAVSSITSEEGKVTLKFDNSNTGDSFTLTEEASSWDSNALMTNYVKEAFGENYTIVREQGLTIYIGGSDAAWVNGGNVYKIKTDSGALTNKQIKSIAVSL